MSITKTLNGNTRYVPETDEENWGAQGTAILSELIDLVNPSISLSNNRQKLSGYQLASPFQTVTVTTASVTIDFEVGRNIRLVLQSNTSLQNFLNPKGGDRYFFHIIQDGVGGRSISWPGAIKWRGASPPILTTTANARNVVALMYDDIDGIYLGEYAINYA